MNEDFNFMDMITKGITVLIVAVFMIAAISYIQVPSSIDDTPTDEDSFPKAFGPEFIRISSDYDTDSSTTSGIQEALDSLSVSGGILFIPAGTHDISETIIIPSSNIIIRGVGSATILNASSLAGDFFYFSDKNNIFIRDLDIDGTDQSSGDGINADGTCIECRYSNIGFSGVFGDDVVGTFLYGPETSGINIPDVFVVNSDGEIVVSRVIHNVRISKDFAVGSTTGGIQEALDDLPATGGMVYNPPGDYTISSKITVIKPDTTITGAGNSSVLTLAAGVDDDMFELADTALRCEISHFAMEGDKANNASGSGIVGIDSENLHVHHMYITHFKESGVKTTKVAADPTECVIESNHIHGCDGDGIWFETIARNCTARDNVCNNNLNGIRVGTTVTGGPNTIHGNTCNWNTNNGIMINVNESIVSDNLCSSNSYHGIYMYARGGARIVSNTSMYNARDGIRVYRSDDCLISNNRVSDNGDGWANIHIEGDGTDTANLNIISGNHCQRFGAWETDYGIRIVGGANASDNILSNNVCAYNDVANISDAGANTIHMNNVTDTTGWEGQDVPEIYQINSDGEIVFTRGITEVRISIGFDTVAAASTTDGIQEALDDLPADGGAVFIPPGNYTISTTINVTKPDTKIFGAGNASHLDLANSVNDDMFEIAATAVRCEISDFSMDGNLANNTTSAGINAIDSENLHIHNMYITHFVWDGIKINRVGSDPSENLIESNHIHGCGSNGIHFQTLVKESSIINNICNNNEYGIHVAGGGRNRISGNVCRWNSMHGIYDEGGSNVISENVCTNNTRHGIYVFETTSVMVLNNTLFTNTRSGIVIMRSSNCYVSNNNSWDNGNGYSNIEINGDATGNANDNTIIGNHCARYGGATTDHGIYIKGGAYASGNRLFDNYCHGHDVSDLRDDGVQTVYGHNKFDQTGASGYDGKGLYERHSAFKDLDYCRIIDEDFVGIVVDSNDLNVTIDAGGAASLLDDRACGVYELTTNAGAADGVLLDMNDIRTIDPSLEPLLAVRAKWTTGNNNVEFKIGFEDVDGTDNAYFIVDQSAIGSLSIYAEIDNNGAQTHYVDTGVDLDTSWHIYEIYHNPSDHKTYFYIDGALVVTSDANDIDETEFFQIYVDIRSEDADAKVLEVDFIKGWQMRE